MRRRRFLHLAAATAVFPALPAGLRAAPAYSRTTYSRAVMHARLTTRCSAVGLAARLKLSMPQAEAILAEMATQQIVHPDASGGFTAAKSIVDAKGWGRNGKHMPQRAARQDVSTPRNPVRVSALNHHLHQLCRRRGLPLSPRCALPEVQLR